MKKVAYLFTIFNFGADLSIGIIVSLALCNIFGIEITFNTIFLGMLFSILPDLDMLVEIPLLLINKVTANQIHREYTHFPLLYVPIALMLFLQDAFYGLLFVTLIFMHFLHDSIGTAWGIAWLFPFNKNYYKFFSNGLGETSSNFLQSWSPSEHKKVIKDYGDHHWLENLYIRSHFLKNLRTSTTGPSHEWLKEYYKSVRWTFYIEVIITVIGVFTLINLIEYLK